MEVLTSLAILGLVSSSVLVVIDRCIASAADSALRMEAFQLVRENLEKILVSDSVSETAEYGRSDTYADITWQTVVEAFPEPVMGQMWLRAVCSAEYVDSKSETQKLELVHWITALTDQQAGQIMQEEDLAQLEAEQLLQNATDAAEYAGIDEETLDQWLDDGLVATGDGRFIKYNLDVFIESGGNPTPQEKVMQVESVKELAMALRMAAGDASGGPAGPGEDPVTGLPYEQLDQMDVGDVMNLLQERQR